MKPVLKYICLFVALMEHNMIMSFARLEGVTVYTGCGLTEDDMPVVYKSVKTDITSGIEIFVCDAE